MNRNAYCPTCNEVVALQIAQREEARRYHGEEFVFLAKYAECPTCHQEFLIPETHDVNLEYLQSEYRRKHQYLSPDQILTIRQEYGLSARSFARILGLGDVSITRYEKGAIPDEALHNLILLSENPNNFSILFERNKGKLSEAEQQRVMATIQKARVMVVWQSWTDTANVAPSSYSADTDYDDCLECKSA